MVNAHLTEELILTRDSEELKSADCLELQIFIYRLNNFRQLEFYIFLANIVSIFFYILTCRLLRIARMVIDSKEGV